MLHIIDNHLAAGCQPLLNSMFTDRKRLFVDLFGWDVPVVEGRYELDQFDTQGAVYIIFTGEDGQHAASLRLLPTNRPHMMGTIFQHLCPAGVPAGDRIWESTRLCLPQRHGAERRRELRNRLISAMVDFGLARGIDCYTGVIPEAFRKEVLAMGWRAEPLGPAVPTPGGAVGAFIVHIDKDTPSRLAWTGTYVSEKPEVAA
ncbi:acyl-homoserine-lactone synthase [Sphingobium sp. MI1205]|uniref:acyl-homoserine-lactone synthase n=1 Tax=Sphingobium sp. MI1205 TaxID=407020 RepID=UPI00076FF049|nr:acyl-homoserine-lactone synthase [Sphingobium sp. MI1205]AMK18905.1 putative autoinducer synthesis protein [Sphingobium sp. MI1205]